MTAPVRPTASAPRFYINAWSARIGQRFLARLVDSAVAVIVVLVVLAVGPHGRPLAQDLIIVALVTTIEALALSRNGTTLGMRAVGIKVTEIGRSGPPDWLTACRRTVPVALCYPILLPGLFTVLVMPVALIASIALSPQRRGFHDRLSHTVVVQEDAPALITEADLDLWWHLGRSTVMSPWGRVPGLYDRRRARAHRLDGAWWLAAAIAVGGIASVGLRGTPWIWLWATMAWIVIMVIDETITVTNRGATPGHIHFGYRVVDVTTGQPPTRARALLRSLVVTPMLYIPPFQVLLALWVQGSSLHRGPHDLIANTVVVEPGYEPPVFAVAPPPPTPAPTPMWPGPQSGPWYPPTPHWTPPPPPGAPPPPALPGPLPPPPVPGPF